MFRFIKKSYHQFSLNNLMKIESLEFKLYFDVVFFFFFVVVFFFFCFFVLFFVLTILIKYFPDARLSQQIRKLARSS